MFGSWPTISTPLATQVSHVHVHDIMTSSLDLIHLLVKNHLVIRNVYCCQNIMIRYSITLFEIINEIFIQCKFAVVNKWP